MTDLSCKFTLFTSEPNKSELYSGLCDCPINLNYVQVCVTVRGQRSTVLPREPAVGRTAGGTPSTALITTRVTSGVKVADSSSGSVKLT